MPPGEFRPRVETFLVVTLRVSTVVWCRGGNAASHPAKGLAPDVSSRKARNPSWNQSQPKIRG